jgi:CheY-like chemotaxis protein
MKPPSLDIFQKQLRSALNHLYNLDYLRQSPLGELFHAADQIDTPVVLQRILIDAIENLHPKPEIPIKSQAWNTYNILLYRYIQRLGQEEVAIQLGVSPRQLAREQELALEMLAYALWEQFQLSEETAIKSGTIDLQERVTDEKEEVAEDLNWLSEIRQDQPTDLHEALDIVLNLAQPLILRHSVKPRVSFDENLPNVAVHSVGLRQALLSLVSVAIHHAVEGELSIQITETEPSVTIYIEGKGKQLYPMTAPSDEESLRIVHLLMELSKGQFNIVTGEGQFQAILVLPVFHPVTILVIDDNPDFFQLMERFVSRTRYQIVYTRSPADMISLAEKNSPQIIVLDVMMPEIDGWQIIGKLRQHPLTHQIPIVICTILAQEELAYALGASAFIHKPITRETLLSTLDLLTSKEIPGSR